MLAFLNIYKINFKLMLKKISFLVLCAITFLSFPNMMKAEGLEIQITKIEATSHQDYQISWKVLEGGVYYPEKEYSCSYKSSVRNSDLSNVKEVNVGLHSGDNSHKINISTGDWKDSVRYGEYIYFNIFCQSQDNSQTGESGIKSSSFDLKDPIYFISPKDGDSYYYNTFLRIDLGKNISEDKIDVYYIENYSVDKGERTNSKSVWGPLTNNTSNWNANSYGENKLNVMVRYRNERGNIDLFGIYSGTYYVEDQRKLEILTPKEGDIYKIGDTMTIEYDFYPAVETNQPLTLYQLYKGDELIDDFLSVVEGKWKIGANLEPGNDYRIRGQLSGPKAYSGYFSIVKNEDYFLKFDVNSSLVWNKEYTTKITSSCSGNPKSLWLVVEEKNDEGWYLVYPLTEFSYNPNTYRINYEGIISNQDNYKYHFQGNNVKFVVPSELTGLEWGSLAIEVYVDGGGKMQVTQLATNKRSEKYRNFKAGKYRLYATFSGGNGCDIYDFSDYIYISDTSTQVPVNNISQKSISNNNVLKNRLKGKILLKVEDKGKAYYVNPQNETIHYLGRPTDAFRVMREQGLGISEKNFNSFNGYASSNLAGRILLRVEAKGEAYYVDPSNFKLHYLGRPTDAFNVMRNLGLGISNSDFDSLGN